MPSLVSRRGAVEGVGEVRTKSARRAARREWLPPAAAVRDYFVRREFARILQRAALRPIRFHDLRHTFATLQLGNRQPVKIVSEMMGHSRTTITQDLYTHVPARIQRQAAVARNDLLTASVESGPSNVARDPLLEPPTLLAVSVGGPA